MHTFKQNISYSAYKMCKVVGCTTVLTKQSLPPKMSTAKWKHNCQYWLLCIWGLFQNCHWSVTSPYGPLSVGWSVGPSSSSICHNFLTGRKVTHPCSYRRSCFNLVSSYLSLTNNHHFWSIMAWVSLYRTSPHPPLLPFFPISLSSVSGCHTLSMIPHLPCILRWDFIKERF